MIYNKKNMLELVLFKEELTEELNSIKKWLEGNRNNKWIHSKMNYDEYILWIPKDISIEESSMINKAYPEIIEGLLKIMINFRSELLEKGLYDDNVSDYLSIVFI